MFFKKHTTVHAPDFPPRDPEAKATLVHFWNLSCFFCISSVLQLKRWHDVYTAHGLRVIGVQSPEFSFEKDESVVQDFLAAHHLDFPVVLDADHRIWKSYHNSCSPCSYLINHRSEIIYTHAGCNGYAQTEFAIQSALHDAGAQSLPSSGPDQSMGGTVFYPRTKDVYAGYLRGALPDVTPDHEQAFTAKPSRADGVITLHGHWTIHAESAEHTRHLASPSEYAAITYQAHQAFAVLSATHPCDCLVELGGAPVPEDLRGPDLHLSSTGQTLLTITRSGLYHLITSPTSHHATLKLSFADPGIHLYALSFA